MKNYRFQLKVGWRNDLEEKLAAYTVDRLIEVRKQMGLSQRHLAKLLGRSNAYISQIEAGRLDIGIVDLTGIAWLLDKPIEYFILDIGKDAPKPDSAERELIEQFRNITDVQMKDIAIKQIRQLAEISHAPKLKRRRKT